MNPETMPPSEETSPPPKRSKFDVSRIRMGSTSTPGIKLTKVLTSVPVMKPNKQQFIRVHRGEEYRFQAYVIDSQFDDNTYLVDSSLHDRLSQYMNGKTLYLAITREGEVFFWPVKMATVLGDLDPWNASAHEIARQAQDKWISMRSNRPVGRYDAVAAEGNLEEPVWPDRSLDELLELAFKDRVIDAFDHPIVRKLRGLE